MTAKDAAASLRTAAPGTLLGQSRPVLISPSQIADFADVTDDRQWIHVDAERAASGPYGAPIAHGYLLLSLLPAFTRDVVDLPALGIAINYGLDRVRFLAPARSGSTIVDRITLAERTEKSAGILYGFSHELVNTASGEVVCVARSLTLLRES